MPEEELRRAKDHLKGSLVLGLESTSSRMGNLARQELYFDRFFRLDEMLESIEAVTADEGAEAGPAVLRSKSNTAVAMLGQPGGIPVSPRRSEVC